MKFEDNLVKKVDMTKVKIDVLKPWITKRIYEMLKMEDDVVVEFIFNQLEEKVSIQYQQNLMSMLWVQSCLKVKILKTILTCNKYWCCHIFKFYQPPIIRWVRYLSFCFDISTKGLAKPQETSY